MSKFKSKDKVMNWSQSSVYEIIDWDDIAEAYFVYDTRLNVYGFTDEEGLRLLYPLELALLEN